MTTRPETRQAALDDRYPCDRCGTWHPIDHYLVAYTTADELLVRRRCMRCRHHPERVAHDTTWTEPTLFDHPPQPISPDITNDAIVEVYNHWRTTLGKHANTTLTRARRTKIIDALRHFDADTVYAAIDGIVLSDWHMGRNPAGKRYDDLTVILRDAAQIERFSALARRGSTQRPAELF